MDDFEKQLKQVPLMKPSVGLNQRIFDEQARPSWFAGLFARRISLGWAAVFALFVGFAGYALAHLSDYRINQPTAPLDAAVDVQIVETGTDRNFFDFSHPSGDMLPGELITTIEVNEEV